MRTWQTLSQEERNEIVSKAHQWEQEHSEHVAELIGVAECSYPPSGSDLWHPELWKTSHWQWFFTGGL